MYELVAREARIGERARKSRRTRGYDLCDLNVLAVEGGDDFHQAIITSVRDALTLRQSLRREVTVIIVQPAKDLSSILYGSRELNHVIYSILLDAGAIHSGVHVDEQPDSASLPCP